MAHQGSQVSACALVKGTQRNLFVVPTSGTFEEEKEELKSLQEEADADPSMKGQLMKKLHVSCMHPFPPPTPCINMPPHTEKERKKRQAKQRKADKRKVCATRHHNRSLRTQKQLEIAVPRQQAQKGVGLSQGLEGGQPCGATCTHSIQHTNHAPMTLMPIMCTVTLYHML